MSQVNITNKNIQNECTAPGVVDVDHDSPYPEGSVLSDIVSHYVEQSLRSYGDGKSTEVSPSKGFARIRAASEKSLWIGNLITVNLSRWIDMPPAKIEINRNRDGNWEVTYFSSDPGRCGGKEVGKFPTLRKVAWAIEVEVCEKVANDLVGEFASGVSDERAIEISSRVRELNRHVRSVLGFRGDAVAWSNTRPDGKDDIYGWC